VPGIVRAVGRPRHAWPWFAALAVITLAAVALQVPRQANRSDLSRPAPAIGHPAPDFLLPSLTGGRGGIRAFRGHPILLQFWAVNCPSCVKEQADLLAASRTFKARGGAVVGVDAYLEPPSVVKAYTRLHPLPYTSILLDPDGQVVLGQYHLIGVPTSYFIRRDGTIASISVGQMNKAAFTTAFDAISG
jgi:peroxiredoxin